MPRTESVSYFQVHCQTPFKSGIAIHHKDCDESHFHSISTKNCSDAPQRFRLGSDIQVNSKKRMHVLNDTLKCFKTFPFSKDFLIRANSQLF